MKTSELEERAFHIDDPRDPLRTLRGRLVFPAGAEQRGRRLAHVLVMHGFKGFMDWGFFPELARRLAARGLAVVRFNFSGSGVGEDPLELTDERAFFANTPSRELEDAQRVRAWIESGAAPVLDARRGALLGHSLGGAVALLHAARRGDYRAVVGWSSVATLRRFPPEVEALWRRQGFVEIPNLRTKQVHRLGLAWLEDIDAHTRELDVHDACRRLTAPVLLVHGDQDEAVPLAEGESLLAAFRPGSARLEVVPGANHAFGAVHPFAGTTRALEHALGTTADFLAGALL